MATSQKVEDLIKELIESESSSNLIARTAIEIISQKGLMTKFKNRLKENLKRKER